FLGREGAGAGAPRRPRPRVRGSHRRPPQGPAAVLRAGSGVGGSHNRAPPRTGAVPMVHPGPSRKLRRELRGAFREERRTRAGPVPALFFRPSRMPTRMSDIEISDRLVDDIIAGDCVAFVGAGFTAPVLPEWRQLLVDLAAETDQATAEGVRRFVESGTNRDLGAAAQTLRDRLGDDYFF